eukprot:scaffold40177_cov18-Tisochrysis_lutea.AAC.1
MQLLSFWETLCPGPYDLLDYTVHTVVYTVVQGPRPYMKLHLKIDVKKHKTGDVEQQSLRT